MGCKLLLICKALSGVSSDFIKTELYLFQVTWVHSPVGKVICSHLYVDMQTRYNAFLRLHFVAKHQVLIPF